MFLQVALVIHWYRS
uniref:Uncharacterized protein n=1 Tax=Arundo donax TaxID=35708 RepID=A0A0A9EEZ9_ARUDO